MMAKLTLCYEGERERWIDKYTTKLTLVSLNWFNFRNVEATIPWIFAKKISI